MASSVVLAEAPQAPDTGSAVYGDTQGPVELLPNPDFVFPARANESKSHRRQNSSIARRPRSAQNLAATANNTTKNPAHQARASVSALPLPSFTFNPATATTGAESAHSTPPLSPMLSSPPTPSRSRHRRGGSELIGDGHVSGSASIASSSPQQSSFTAPPPSAQITLGPPPARRHAHRRSGAISCHDLASILQSKDANVQTRSGSAPTSPLDLDDKGFQFPTQFMGKTEESSTSQTHDEISNFDQQPTRRSFSRNRVGFADRVEYIRPLSTISSETESSMSTIRGHSVNGSWSSIVSANQMSPVRRGRPSLDTTFEVDDVIRPTSCQSGLASRLVHTELLHTKQSNEIQPQSEAGSAIQSSETVSMPKSKSFSWWESKPRKPVQEQPEAYAKEAKEEITLPSSPPATPKTRHSLDSDQETIRHTQVDAERKKPRKVKSWAHSLITRKHKSKQNLRPATPPASCVKTSDDSDGNSLASEPDHDDSALSFNFDNDITITIIDQTNQPQTTTPQISYSMTQSSQPVTDNASPVIDLDTAMSPVRGELSPTGRAQRQTRSRQSMHSATLTSGAFNFASHHRRTESAPQLKPFELRSAQPFTSSIMPDVFEEEDEEVEEHQTAKSASRPVSSSALTETVVRRQPVEPLSTSLPVVTGFHTARSQKTVGSSIDSGSRPTSLTLGTAEMTQQAVGDFAVDLKIVGTDDSIGSPSATEERSGTPFSEYKISGPPPLLYPLPLPSDQVMTPGTASDASVYSPFFCPSQTSLVGQRLGTGTSFINERSSFFFGEPGPELRVSVDDVPSLSSSRSTMTSPAVHHGLPSSSGGGGSPSIYSIRSATMTDFTRQKRGSIASLSRLVADRFERSKLSIETRPVTSSADSTIKAKKLKHRHKLSKLMSFWRSKESC